MRLEQVDALVALAPQRRAQPWAQEERAGEAPVVDMETRQARIEATQDARPLGARQQVQLRVGKTVEQHAQRRRDHHQITAAAHADDQYTSWPDRSHLGCTPASPFIIRRGHSNHAASRSRA
jgi:hypothetical protein